MNGLFHLQSVAKLSRSRETPLEGMLGKAIRECSSQIRDRNIPLEDFYYEVLSFWRIREDVFMVRFSNVNDKGKPYGSMSAITTLMDITMILLRAKMHVYTNEDREPHYDHFYEPRTFADTDYIWVPDNNYVKTVIAKYKS